MPRFFVLRIKSVSDCPKYIVFILSGHFDTLFSAIAEDPIIGQTPWYNVVTRLREATKTLKKKEALAGLTQIPPIRKEQV